jgi:hypothetical protein
VQRSSNIDTTIIGQRPVNWQISGGFGFLPLQQKKAAKTTHGMHQERGVL